MNEQRHPTEFQAVIITEDEADRFYALTEDKPKALLPIANKPMIYYPLTYLENAGFKEVIVVLTKKNAVKVGKYLKEAYKGKLLIRIETIDDGADSADALRSVHKYITSDFIVMSDDLVTDVPLVNVANIHRSHNSAVTMVLKQHPKNESTSSGGGTSTSGTEDSDRAKHIDYLGLVDYGPHISATFTDTKHSASTKSALFKCPCRVAYFSPSVELKDDLVIRRSFLRRWPNVLLSKNYSDSHLYIFSKWVIDMIAAQKEMKSLKREVLPYLVDLQRYMKRNLQKQLKEEGLKGLSDFVENNKNQNYEVVPGVKVKNLLQTQQAAFEMSSAPHDHLDLIRCYAYIVSTAARSGKALPEGVFAKRALTMSSYMEINRDLAKKGEVKMYDSVLSKSSADDVYDAAPSTPIITPTSSTSVGDGSTSSAVSGEVSEEIQVGLDCVVGFGLQYTGPSATQGPRRVSSTLKRSNVGHHCKIGANVKIVNSVVMNHVTIGDNCTIQNSIVCSNSYIQPKTILNNCQVGYYHTVESGDYKGETLTRDKAQ